MRHTIRRSPWVMLALPLLVAVVAAAEGPGSPSIRALMHRQYTVSRAPFKIIRTQMDAQVPDWEKVQQAGEKFVALAETLAKKTPRHGGEESWRHFLDRAHGGRQGDGGRRRGTRSGPLAGGTPADRGIVQVLSRGPSLQAGKRDSPE